MENQNNVVIYVYRYMWLFENNENMQIKVISGVPEEHKQFMEVLKNDKKVTKAVRVYLHEYDVNLIEFFESIKEEKKEKEVNEEIEK